MVCSVVDTERKEMKITITIPALEYGTYSKAKNTIVYKPIIYGYVSSLRKKRGSGRAEKRDAWYAYAYNYIHSFLAVNCLLPKEPHNERGWKITIQAYHQTRTHMDSLNILKGLEDILVSKHKGKGTFFLSDDKMTAGEYKMAKYDKDNPRVEMLIESDD